MLRTLATGQILNLNQEKRFYRSIAGDSFPVGPVAFPCASPIDILDFCWVMPLNCNCCGNERTGNVDVFQRSTVSDLPCGVIYVWISPVVSCISHSSKIGSYVNQLCRQAPGCSCEP